MPQSPTEPQSTHNDDVLRGLRVLVVEDSYLAALSLANALGDLGCRVVGPAATVDDARPLATRDSCDAAVLDVNLGPETSEPIAAILQQQGLPFLFVTGYQSPALLSEKFRRLPHLSKPVTTVLLGNAMRRALEPQRDR